MLQHVKVSCFCVSTVQWKILDAFVIELKFLAFSPIPSFSTQKMQIATKIQEIAGFCQMMYLNVPLLVV